jgi:ABC-type branched-subunit amino acid transport system permease subunit
VGFTQSYVSSAFTDFWPIILGLMFVLVVVYLPHGLSPVAGRHALLGALLGLIVANIVDRNLGVTLPKLPRVLLQFSVLLVLLFLPRAFGWGLQKLRARPTPAPGAV